MRVIEFLDESGVSYEVTEHKPAFTAQHMAAEEHEPGKYVAKAVIVKADEKHIMCVLSACYKIDLGKLKKHFRGNERIATIMGRFYAMDRKKQWKNTEKAYNAMVLGEGEKVKDPEEAILRAYNRGQTDEFIEPTVIMKGRKPVGTIEDNDVILFFNLRSDRARQKAKVFTRLNRRPDQKDPLHGSNL